MYTALEYKGYTFNQKQQRKTITQNRMLKHYDPEGIKPCAADNSCSYYF